MSAFSTFPELEGIAFPASTARELAEKRVLQQRAEAERIRQIELARIAAEEEAHQAKLARIEAKRLDAEKRLWARAQELAKDDDAAAESVRQERLQREQQAEEARRQAIEEERQRKEKLKRAASIKRRQEEEALRQQEKALFEERERKKQERIRKQLQSERDSELRWLRSQAKSGAVRVVKHNGVFELTAVDPSAQGAVESMGWVATLEDLPDVKHEVVDDPPEVPEKAAPKKKLAFAVAPTNTPGAAREATAQGGARTALEQRWMKSNLAQAVGPTAAAKEVLGAFNVKVWDKLDVSLETLVNNLGGTSSKTQAEALISLFSFHSTLLAEEGPGGFKKVLSDKANAKDLATLPRILAEKLEESPGNALALCILGLLYFAGPDEIVRTIAGLDIIPLSFQEWAGWMIGARLFFEFYAWWGENNHPQSAEYWELGDEAFLQITEVPDTISVPAKQIIESLAFDYLPYGSVSLATAISSKIDLFYCRMLHTNEELSDAISAYQDNVELATSEHSQDVKAQTQHAWDRSNYQVEEAEREFANAKQRVHQIQADIQASKDFLASVDMKKLGLAQRLTALRQQEENLRGEKEDLEAQLNTLMRLNN